MQGRTLRSCINWDTFFLHYKVGCALHRVIEGKQLIEWGAGHPIPRRVIHSGPFRKKTLRINFFLLSIWNCEHPLQNVVRKTKWPISSRPAWPIHMVWHGTSGLSSLTRNGLISNSQLTVFKGYGRITECPDSNSCFPGQGRQFSRTKFCAYRQAKNAHLSSSQTQMSFQFQHTIGTLRSSTVFAQVK